MSLRATRSIGASSPEGSKTTTEPRHSNSVLTAEMDLKLPAPANTRQWVGPLWHGSISKRALPPFPQVLAARGLN